MFIICPKCGAKYQIPADISLKDGQKMKCSACEHLFIFKQSKPVLKEKINEIKNESFQPNPVIPEDAVLTKEELEKVPLSRKIEIPEVFQPTIFVPQPKKNSVLLPVLMVVVSLIVLLILLALAWQYRVELQQQNSFENLKLARLEPIRLTSPEKPKEPVVKKENIVLNNEPVLESTPHQVKEDLSEDETENQKEPLPEMKPYSFRSVRYHIQNDDRVQVEGIIQNEMNQELYLPEYVVATAYGLKGDILFQKAIYLTQKTLPAQQELAFFGTYSPAIKEIKWIDISFPN